MRQYDDIGWDTLDFVKTHLYRQLANPLNLARQTAEANDPAQLQKALHHVSAVINTINAWATLISFKHTGPLSNFQFKPLTADDFPQWLHNTLTRQVELRLTFTSSVEVHYETFFEGMLLLYSVARTISHVEYLQISDAARSINGVYLRVVFSNQDAPPFSSMSDIRSSFDLNNLADRDTAFQLAAAQDMMALNNARLTLQNNNRTDQQAFSAFLRATPEHAHSQVSSAYTAAAVARFAQQTPQEEQGQKDPPSPKEMEGSEAPWDQSSVAQYDEQAQ